jgi:hypothetical protein
MEFGTQRSALSRLPEGERQGGRNENSPYGGKAVPETGHEMSRIIKKHTRNGNDAK